jgi:hypothetical protein
MTPDKMAPETRTRVTSAGGKARAAGDPDALREARAAGGRAANSPASWARRIKEAWPTMTRAERAHVRETLTGTAIPRPKATEQP